MGRAIRPSHHRTKWAASLRVRVAVHNPEQISFGILAISEVSDGGNRRLRHNLRTARAGYRRHSLFHRLDVDGVRDGGNVALFHQAAVNSRRAVRTGTHHPILHRPWPFFDLPAESFLVESGGALGIVSGYFKMYDSRHGSSPVFMIHCISRSVVFTATLQAQRTPGRNVAWRSPR